MAGTKAACAQRVHVLISKSSVSRRAKTSGYAGQSTGVPVNAVGAACERCGVACMPAGEKPRQAFLRSQFTPPWLTGSMGNGVAHAASDERMIRKSV